MSTKQMESAIQPSAWLENNSGKVSASKEDRDPPYRLRRLCVTGKLDTGK